MGGAASASSKNDKQTSALCLARPLVGPDYQGPTLLSADVGGTSSRIHLFLPPAGPPDADDVVPPSRRIHMAKYQNCRFETFTEILRTFLQECNLPKPPMLACLALAGIVVDRKCKFINLGWEIEEERLEAELGIGQVTMINDFVAQGYGILTLNESKDCEVLQSAPKLEGAPMAVIGAGTGLGEAFLTTGANGDYEVWPTEGGHAEFAPRQDGSSKIQFELIQFLQIKFSAKARVSIERVVAGKGISNIYEFLAWKHPEKINKEVHKEWIGPADQPRVFDPSIITKAAVAGKCSLSLQAVNMWCSAYGAEAGVVALTYMPFGGLYLTGGVTNKLRDFIKGKKGESHFMEAFLDKGRVSSMLMRVPVYVVRGENMGEAGAMLKASRLYLEKVKLRQPSMMCLKTASTASTAPSAPRQPSGPKQ